MKTVTLIPGDGIGPEIITSVKSIFTAAQIPIIWEEYNAGADALKSTGELIPKVLLDSIERNRVALKGPIGTPIGTGFKSANVTLRKVFDLYTNLRPVKTIKGIPSRFDNVNIALFRENTEGLYAGLELYDEKLQIADAVKRVTRTGSIRIIRAAFEYARANGRKKVTLFHKANILKVSMGMFLSIGREIAAEYPDIAFDDLIIDNAFMQLVIRPERFDVCVTTNMFGDIVSDLLAGLVGGLGVVGGANIGENAAIFEAVHGSAPDIAGQNKANPTGILKSAVLMLEYLEMKDKAALLENALHQVLADPNKRTKDLGGNCSTTDFTNHLIIEITRQL